MKPKLSFLWHKCPNLPNPLWFIPVVIALVVLMLVIGIAQAVEVIQWDKFTNKQIVQAIGKAENSIKYPYGIKSIDTKGDKEYAYKICLNSVRNGRKRWIKAGKPYDLITFIGMRYCPPKAHPLNSNWVKNVKAILKRNN